MKRRGGKWEEGLAKLETGQGRIYVLRHRFSFCRQRESILSGALSKTDKLFPGYILYSSRSAGP